MVREWVVLRTRFERENNTTATNTKNSTARTAPTEKSAYAKMKSLVFAYIDSSNPPYTNPMVSSTIPGTPRTTSGCSSEAYRTIEAATSPKCLTALCVDVLSP